MAWSKHQTAIFDFIETGRGSAIVNAVAGSGKTTTIVNALERIPRDRKVLFLAFNKSIAQELSARVPQHVMTGTFHAQGMKAWQRSVGGRVEVDGKKLRGIAERLLCVEEDDGKGGTRYRRTWEHDAYATFVVKLVSLAKGAGMGYLTRDEPDAWQELMDHHDVMLDEGNEADAIRFARQALKLSNDLGREVIDFDDMLYLPLINNVRFFQNDLVFVDEAQDTNGVQIALLKRMLKPSGRLVAVGDRAQAIYGFRGADSGAMDRIAREFDARELPLSISYRCPKKVVQVAQEIVPHIEAAETAAEGSVRSLVSLREADLTDADAVLARKTAPLVDAAYLLIGRGVGCRILGRDLGQGLVALVKKLQAKGVDRLEQKLEEYREREVAKYVSKGQEEKADAVHDRVDSIKAVIGQLGENERTVPKVIRRIEALFDDNGGRKLTLCTVHKAKGMEWQRVFILRPQDMPSPMARQAWQKQQEANLQYVAYTRTQNELIFVADL